MRVRVEDLRRAIDEFALGLLEVGIAVDLNKAVSLSQPNRRVLITWANAGISTPFTDFEFATLSEYLQYVQDRQFSALLFDGSLIQISYTVEGGDDVIDHRLCWYPCPAYFRPEDLELAPLEDIIRSTPSTELRCRGPLRFDYSPFQARDGHSPCHLHAFQEDCRVPVRGPVDLVTFANFIFGHFYPAEWAEKIGSVPLGAWASQCTLADSEYGAPHLYWRPPI
jgi:hypothetical protein